MKPPVCFFTIADENNIDYANKMANSLKKFHPEHDLIIYGPEQVHQYLTQDRDFFYRATPMLARELLKTYELVIKIDADSIVTGNLDHIINDKYFDVGCVLNWNRVDPQLYGHVTVWDVNPTQYFNCGFVAMRNKDFVEKWWQLCQSPHFYSYKYREQDLLNILVQYFDWHVKNLDSENTWNGLISKGEMARFVVKDNELVCPISEDKFPNQEMTVKVLHFAGGNVPNKFTYYRLHCSEEVIAYLDRLVRS